MISSGRFRKKLLSDKSIDLMLNRSTNIRRSKSKLNSYPTLRENTITSRLQNIKSHQLTEEVQSHAAFNLYNSSSKTRTISRPLSILEQFKYK